MNMIIKLTEERKEAFVRLGEFLEQNEFPVANLESFYNSSVYGYVFEYNGNQGILYHTRQIVVSLDNIYIIGKNIPLNYTYWEIIADYHYSSKDKLLSSLNELILGSKNAAELW